MLKVHLLHQKLSNFVIILFSFMSLIIFHRICFNRSAFLFFEVLFGLLHLDTDVHFSNTSFS